MNDNYPQSASRRRVLAVSIVAIPLLVLLIMRFTHVPGAPEMLPSHFGARGQADDWSNTYNYWIAVTVVAALMTAMGAVAAQWVKNQYTAVWMLVGGAFLSAMTASIWITGLYIASKQPDPDQQRMGATLVVVLVGSLGWAGLSYLAHGRPHTDSQLENTTAPVQLQPGQRVGSVQYVQSTLLTWLAVIATLSLLIPAVLMWNVDRAMAIIFFVMTVIVAALVGMLARATVTADARGLRVITWLGVPLARIPLAQIKTVRAQEIEPGQWGGWGLRWMPGGYAYVVRRGPGLVVEQMNGKLFAVTVDNPQKPAGVLLALKESAQVAADSV